MEPRKILLVDDDELVRHFLGTYLTEKGFDVRGADNADDFIREALTFQPHLIILDIMLGDDNGPLVYDRLINEGFDSKVPVIFLSGLADNQAESSASPGRNFTLHSKTTDLKKLVQEIELLVNEHMNKKASGEDPVKN